MADWKTKLYESYITTGQANTVGDLNNSPDIDDYPYLERVIERHLPAEKSTRILDLGCGHGALVYCLHHSGYTNSYGVDVSPEQVAHAQKLGIPNIHEEDLTEYIQSAKHKYDVFFLMDILEHLEKQEVMDLLDTMHEALTDSAKVIIHVPNAEGLFGMRVRYGDFTHELCFSPQSIRQVLHACGYCSIEVYEDKPIIHGLKSMLRYVLWQLLTLPSRLLLLAETGTSGHILSQNMLIIAHKKPQD